MGRNVILFTLLLSVAFLVGCDETLRLFLEDMADLVEYQGPDNLDDPCLLANAQAAAQWYARLSTRHRETLKHNVRRYIRVVQVSPTRVVSDAPTGMARTEIVYNQGVLLIQATGVRTDGRVFCSPDIDVLREFAMDSRLLVSSRP